MRLPGTGRPPGDWVSEEQRLGKGFGSKLMTAREAVDRYVKDGATVGMGGQSIGRCSMALAHEIVRQGKKDLVLVGCNLALSMDVMVGAGAVKRTECGNRQPGAIRHHLPVAQGHRGGPPGDR